jgi:uncharacterized Zn finger protein
VVTARVQGSRAAPYRVKIRLATLDKPTWRKIAEHIASEARFAAKLLAGEIPQDIEGAFTAAGTSLFPTTMRGLHTECSCPDSSNPCKHIAATYYLIGEEFDRDPFLLFTLRGATKAEILSELHGAGTVSPVAIAERVPLPPDLESFWGKSAPTDAPLSTASVDLSSSRRGLPPFAFWRGTEPFEASLAQIDERAAPAGLAILTSDPVNEGR